MSGYRNLVARNWDRATFDLVLGPWHWPWLERRKFVLVADGPTERRYRLWLGPIHVTFWPKSPAGRGTEDV